VATVLITGANGHLGRRLIPALLPEHKVIAVVRSERAAAQLSEFHNQIAIHCLSYTDETGLAGLMSGVDFVVHLVGILKESETSSYYSAHEATCELMSKIASGNGVKRIIYLSILGSSIASDNACLRSKGSAEQLLLAGATPTSVLQVPMVLGENDFASFALKKRATKSFSLVFRASSLEQPIYAGDVVAAVMAAMHQTGGNYEYQLAGPESLSRKALTERAAIAMGRTTKVISLPIVMGLLLASLLESVLKSPPVTRSMMEVLDHDDQVDPQPAVQALGIRLTPLDTTLTSVLG